ncbi:MAG: hypothetical protein ACTH56_08825 [Pseudoalteromonas sp.]|uniref:hypothetical protein n=1 Tax=Pseudoalteromonas prydzensis TaxID=182141 RepID=UPI003F9E1504
MTIKNKITKLQKSLYDINLAKESEYLEESMLYASTSTELYFRLRGALRELHKNSGIPPTLRDDIAVIITEIDKKVQ